MPDHVHLLIVPSWRGDGVTYGLPEILRRIKGRSSREINLTLTRTGAAWQDESHDHQLRNDESVRQKAEYIAQNPVRWGLVANPDAYPWLYRAWKN